MQKEILVWYLNWIEYQPQLGFNTLKRVRTGPTGSIHLTVLNNSIAYTIAEYESRNRDKHGNGQLITAYMDEHNTVVNVQKPYYSHNWPNHERFTITPLNN